MQYLLEKLNKDEMETTEQQDLPDANEAKARERELASLRQQKCRAKKKASEEGFTEKVSSLNFRRKILVCIENWSE